VVGTVLEASPVRFLKVLLSTILEVFPPKFSEAVLSKVLSVETLLAKRALESSEYLFSTDWVSKAVPLWTRYLGQFRGLENVHLLEIGSSEGRSAIWFLDNVLTHPTSSITCVDVFTSRKAEVRFDHNIKISGLSNKVTKIKGKSQEVLKLLKESSYDIIYIDGSHRAVDVHTDALLSWALLKPGGIIIFDDYYWKPEKPPEARPQMAIDTFLNDFQSQIEILYKGYQVIVKRKYSADGSVPDV
jgi:predicted O-methyltransferase YrrM